MVKASRKTKTIVARPPMYRDQLLKPIVNSVNDDSEDIFEDGLFEHYIVRPDCLEKLCICDYAADFEYSSYQRSKNINNEDDNSDDINEEMFDEEDKDDIVQKIPAGTQFKLKDGSGFITKR